MCKVKKKKIPINPQSFFSERGGINTRLYAQVDRFKGTYFLKRRYNISFATTMLFLPPFPFKRYFHKRLWAKIWKRVSGPGLDSLHTSTIPGYFFICFKIVIYVRIFCAYILLRPLFVTVQDIIFHVWNHATTISYCT